jgi:CRISPR-associated protein Cas6
MIDRNISSVTELLEILLGGRIARSKKSFRQDNGLLALNSLSSLTLRIPAEKIPEYLGLSGKTVAVEGHNLTIGAPTILQLKPRTALYSHLVTTKNGNDEERFRSELHNQMEILGVQGRVTMGKRKTFKVHGKQIVGYSLLITELTAEESLLVQEKGLGGRRKMGCGIFIGIR